MMSKLSSWLRPFIYLSNIQSVSEDSGCGLFVYRIYEEYHKSLWVLNVRLLLHLFFLPGLYNKTHIQSLVQLEGNSNLVKLSL